MPKGAYIRRRKASRKPRQPKASTSKKEKSKQVQKVMINISAGGAGGTSTGTTAERYVPQFLQQQQPLIQQASQIPQVAQNFNTLLQDKEPIFNRSQNLTETIKEPPLKNVVAPKVLLESESEKFIPVKTQSVAKAVPIESTEEIYSRIQEAIRNPIKPKRTRRTKAEMAAAREAAASTSN